MDDDLTLEERLVRRRIIEQFGDPPPREKPIEQMTPADHDARRRGEEVVSAEYLEYEAKLHRAGGLEPAEPAEPSIEDLDPAAHAARKYGGAA